MLKVAVVGKKTKEVEKQIPKFDLKLVEKKPDFVIAYGGDGTLLYSEQLYPSVPKVMIVHHSGCKKCSKHDFSEILTSLKIGDYKVLEQIKIEANAKGKKLVGLNEVNIHYSVPQALRFKVKINRKELSSIFIGDGLVVSTPYGSSAYFNAITKKIFYHGLGIAFNNVIGKPWSKVVDESSVIEVEVKRGKGTVNCDNSKDIEKIRKGDIISIRKSKEKAYLLKVKGHQMKITNY